MLEISRTLSLNSRCQLEKQFLKSMAQSKKKASNPIFMLFRSTKKNLHHDLIVNSFQLEVRFMMRITRCPRLATDQFDLIHDCNSTFILLTDFDQRALVLPKQTPILQKVK